MFVPFPFTQNSGRTEGTKKTATTCLIAARKKPIRLITEQVNKVKRIGAFSWGMTKKQPWAEAIAAELALCLPDNAEARKEDRPLLMDGCCGGVTRPSQRLTGCRCGYTSFSATAEMPKMPTTGRTCKSVQMVGATTDPRYGCSVNTTESASRLTRLHPKPFGSEVALTGGDACPNYTPAQLEAG